MSIALVRWPRRPRTSAAEGADDEASGAERGCRVDRSADRRAPPKPAGAGLDRVDPPVIRADEDGPVREGRAALDLPGRLERPALATGSRVEGIEQTVL